MKKPNLTITQCLLLVTTAVVCLNAQANPCQTSTDKAKLNVVQQAYQRQSLLAYDEQQNPRYDNVSRALKNALLHDKACTKNGEEVCALDFEPIFNAQDWNVTKVQYSCAQGLVIARFKNFNQKQHAIHFKVIQEHGIWLIDDLHSKQVPSLKRMLLTQ
ncbi:MAG: hypothetical protein H6R05_50 [Burkholderiaceae bacterium]|nr:hypothetical protein [Burkholderiaceae bacterium]